MFSGNTVDTTRIWGEDILSVMTNAFQMIYPGYPTTMVHWRPNAITVAPASQFQYAFTASSLVHDPNKAPMMLVSDQLNEEVKNEMLRLSPIGNQLPAQVLLIGPVNSDVQREIQALGLSTYRIGNQDPYQTSLEVSQFRLLHPSAAQQGRENVFLLSGETFAETMFVPNYSMHQGIPVLLTEKNNVPAPIQHFFSMHPDLNVYIVGTFETVSQHVEASLHRYTRGKVVRLTGASPYDLSVRFSRFFDEETQLGWNRNQKNGNAFSFVNHKDWRHAIISGLFSHLGKHAPLLLTQRDSLPRDVKEYLRFLRPERKKPPQPPFMHGFVFGDFHSIDYRTQIEIEESIIFPTM
ncbi:cell wall-binding repeat-containing protein [Brevibacillus invocatus]|uniref:Cell wall-binding repeat-containing protein n=1 Tax=Brevibacillus invocatus TaxID=173959 RepID=A0A3M8BVR6_9BACL|nr:cell wall-binding repeat-containing protein [Brevibacillus invocatus]RNB67522.1 cell wall-binding repeat-containing protein [Brevibacillus invocatus]